MIHRAIYAVAVLGGVAACEGAKAPAANAPDAAGPAACKHPTKPYSSCIDRWCDNEWHVGMPCSKTGDECSANKPLETITEIGAVLCTALFTTEEAFCTKPCVEDVECGKGAVCRGDPSNPNSGKGCLLYTCAGPAPAASDASNSDTSGSDVTGSDAVATPDAVTPAG